MSGGVAKPTNAERLGRPATPPGIEVFTPPSTPTCELEYYDDTTLGANCYDATQDGDEIPDPPIHSQAPAGPSGTTDLHNDTSTALQTATLSSVSMHWQPAASPNYDTDAEKHLAGQSFLLRWFSAVFSVPSTNQTQGFLARTASQEAGARLSTTAIDPILRSIILENVNTDRAPMLMIKRIRNEGDLQALRSLLRLRGDTHTTLQAFAQRLLLPATVDGNIALVQILLEAGVDPNTRTRLDSREDRDAGNSHSHTRHRHSMERNQSMTALHIAVYNRREDMIKLLLRHGATDWRAEFQGANGYVFGSILDVIMEMGTHKKWTTQRNENNQLISRSLLKTVLFFGSSSMQHSHEMLMRALRHAVLQNRLDLVNILCHYHPRLLKTAKKIPWILLEAAATLPDLRIFEFLIGHGFSLTTTSTFGHGSVVAAAVATMSNGEHITQLLHANVDINSKAFGLGTLKNDTQATTTEAKLSDIYGMTALHIAVRRNNDMLTRLLLYHGANPNICCGVYPIQIAAWNGHEPIADMLIKAGADIHAVSRGGQSYVFKHDGFGSRSISAQTTATELASDRGHSRLVSMLNSIEPKTPE
jgi:hypothetical protein